MRFVFVLLTLLSCASAQNDPVQRLNTTQLAAYFQNQVREVMVLGLPGGALEGLLLEGLARRQLAVSILLGRADAAQGRRWAQAGATVRVVDGGLSGGVALVNGKLLLVTQHGGLLVSSPGIARRVDQLWRLAVR